MSADTGSHRPRPDRPTIVYDGECGFCRRSVSWLLLRTGARLDAIAYQNFDFSVGPAELDRESCRQAAHLYDPRDGTVVRGAAAAARALAEAPGRGWVWWVYRWIPGVAPLLSFGYRRVAANRVLVAKFQRTITGTDLAASTFLGGRRLFLMLVGLAFAALFASLLAQQAAVFGGAGVEPIATLWDWNNENYGIREVLGTPSLFWLGTGDGIQIGLLCAGLAAGVALALGLAPWIALLVCGAVGLSFSALAFPPSGARGAAAFTGFVWEALMIEIAFLGLFVAPPGLLPGARWRRMPSGSGAWLLRLLLVRVLFVEGLFRAGLGDGSWAAEGAFATHLVTQPLPTGTALTIVHWHPAILTTIDRTLLVIELVAPWLMFLPRRLRWWGFVAIVFHELVRFATGVVGVYPLAIVALAAFNLDDRLLRRVLPLSVALRLDPLPMPRASWLGPLRAGLALALTALAVLVSVERLETDDEITAVHAAIAPWQIVNGYAPFGAVDPVRYGLVLEVSPDGERDVAVAFRQSPSDPLQRPAWPSLAVERLAWNWSLLADRVVAGAPEPEWVTRLTVGLLEGRQPLVDRLRPASLVGAFDEGPPRQLRIRGFRYLPSASAARATGPWWTREPLDIRGPRLELRDGKLVPVVR